MRVNVLGSGYMGKQIASLLKLIGFDVFSDEFPTTEFEEDNEQRDHWLGTAGGSSIDVKQLTTIIFQ